MKLLGVVSTAVLSLTLGATALAYPQQEQREQEEQKDKPAQAEEKKAQPEKPAKQPAKPPAKQAEKAAPKPNQNAKPEAAHQQPARTPQAQPKPQAQHASAHGGRIPDDRYKANFGRQHTFRVSQGDYGNRRFQYGGYWFGFAGAWPSNWLYTQDVYVIDIDGVYYLCNPNYPGVNVELNVTL